MHAILPITQVPDWMLSLKKLRPKERRKLEVSAPKRRSPSTKSGYDKSKEHKKKMAIKNSKEKKKQKVEGV